MNSQSDGPRSLRPKEAAKLLGISGMTLYRYAKKPGFPAPMQLSPACTVYDRDELLAWREAQRRKAPEARHDEGVASVVGEIMLAADYIDPRSRAAVVLPDPVAIRIARTLRLVARSRKLAEKIHESIASENTK